MNDRRMLELVCTGGGYHREAIAFRYDGPWPLPPNYSPALRMPSVTSDLRCEYRRCRRAPRPSDEVLRRLLLVAATMPDDRLDISMLDL
jgi:hypothetical protein